MFPDVSGEGGQSGGQFQGRPSEVWSQWQNQHHSQQSGEQHSHANPSQTEVFQVQPKALRPDPRLQTYDLWPHVSVGHAAYGWRSHPGDSELQHWGFCGSRHVSTLFWVKVASTTYQWTYVCFLCFIKFFFIKAALGHLRKVNVIVIHYSYLHKTFIIVIS